jgi:hypothetical protein
MLALGSPLLRQGRRPALPLLLQQCRQPPVPLQLLLRQSRQPPMLLRLVLLQNRQPLMPLQLLLRQSRKPPKTLCKSYKAASIRSFLNGWRLRRRKQLPT